MRPGPGMKSGPSSHAFPPLGLWPSFLKGLEQARVWGEAEPEVSCKRLGAAVRHELKKVASGRADSSSGNTLGLQPLGTCRPALSGPSTPTVWGCSCVQSLCWWRGQCVRSCRAGRAQKQGKLPLTHTPLRGGKRGATCGAHPWFGVWNLGLTLWGVLGPFHG